MKSLPPLARPGFFLLLFLAFAWLLVAGSRSTSGRIPAKAVDDNPQQFRVWITSNTISHTFNCDPRAADGWLFRTGGGLTAGGHPVTVNLPTNDAPPRETTAPAAGNY